VGRSCKLPALYHGARPRTGPVELTARLDSENVPILQSIGRSNCLTILQTHTLKYSPMRQTACAPYMLDVAIHPITQNVAAQDGMMSVG
jgi:hypothetical protein